MPWRRPWTAATPSWWTCTRPEPFNVTPTGVNPISSGSPHVLRMGVHRTFGEPNEITKNTHPKSITALFRVQVPDAGGPGRHVQSVAGIALQGGFRPRFHVRLTVCCWFAVAGIPVPPVCADANQSSSTVRPREPFKFTPVGVNTISAAHLRVRPIGRTCRRAGEIKNNTRKPTTSPLCFVGRPPAWRGTASHPSSTGPPAPVPERPPPPPPKVNASCYTLRPCTTPFLWEIAIPWVIYIVLLWADMNAATPPGSRGRSALCAGAAAAAAATVVATHATASGKGTRTSTAATTLVVDTHATGTGTGTRAAFWQWSKMMIEHLPIMGYSMATDVDGHAVRYVPACGTVVHGIEPAYDTPPTLPDTAGLYFVRHAPRTKRATRATRATYAMHAVRTARAFGACAESGATKKTGLAAIDLGLYDT